MSDDTMNQLRRYAELLSDVNCLKVIYYLYKFNPNIPIEDLSTNLDLSKETIIRCLDRLLSANIVLKTDVGRYSLTVFGRTAFKKLIQSPQ